MCLNKYATWFSGKIQRYIFIIEFKCHIVSFIAKKKQYQNELIEITPCLYHLYCQIIYFLFIHTRAYIQTHLFYQADKTVKSRGYEANNVIHFYCFFNLKHKICVGVPMISISSLKSINILVDLCLCVWGGEIEIEKAHIYVNLCLVQVSSSIPILHDELVLPKYHFRCRFSKQSHKLSMLHSISKMSAFSTFVYL